jgi:hypothetical protein
MTLLPSRAQELALTEPGHLAAPSASQAAHPRWWDEAADLIEAQLRAPTAALQELSRTLESGGLSPALAERIRQYTRVLARSVALLIEDLVLVHSAPDHPPVLAPEDLSLADQVERTAALFPDLVIHVASMPGLRVDADPLRLQQLLANLVRGAHDERPLRFDSSVDGHTVTLRMYGGRPVAGHHLDIARMLAKAHGGQLHPGGTRWPVLRLVLPLARVREAG